MAKKISELTPFGLRIPDDIKKQVDRAAKKKGRSVNKEILSYIETCLSGNFDLSAVPLDELVKELIRRNKPGRILIEITPPE